MAIKTNAVRIEGDVSRDVESHVNQRAWMDAGVLLMGFAPMVMFYPDKKYGGHFVIASRADNPNAMFLIGLPAARWEQDLVDDGYTLEQRLRAE